MKPDKKPDNPYAFPLMGRKKDINNFHFQKGMNLLDYFIAHAPTTPQWDFEVPMEAKRPEAEYGTDAIEDVIPINENDIHNWEAERRTKRAKMWATEWASEQLRQRDKYLQTKKLNYGYDTRTKRNV